MCYVAMRCDIKCKSKIHREKSERERRGGRWSETGSNKWFLNCRLEQVEWILQAIFSPNSTQQSHMKASKPLRWRCDSLGSSAECDCFASLFFFFFSFFDYVFQFIFFLFFLIFAFTTDRHLLFSSTGSEWEEQRERERDREEVK